MALWYYISISILSLLCCIIYYWQIRRNFSIYYTFVFILAFVAHMGYLFIALSENVREAMLANKILYVSGCYFPLVGMILVFTICKIHLPKIVRFILVGIASFIYACVLSSGYLPLFYKSVDIKKVNGITVLVKEYGPVHTLYYVLVIICLIATIGVLVYCWIKNPNIPRYMLYLTAFMQISTIISFFLGRVISKDIEWTALADLIDEIGFLIIMNRISLYKVDDLVSTSILKEGQFGYIALDFKNRYLSATSVAKRFLPEIAKNRADKKIDNKELCELIDKWIEEFKKENVSKNHTYRRGEFIYVVRVSYLSDSKRRRGYLLEIYDDTAHQQHLQGIEQFNKNLNDELMYKTRLIQELRGKKI